MLYKLRTGDEFTIELGNSDILRYQVTNVRSVLLEGAAEAMMERDLAIESQLNLITCGGNYDKKTKLYDKRIIVTSKLIATGSSQT